MIKNYVITLLFFLSLTFISAEETSEAAKKVQEDVRKCMEAVYSGDVDTVLTYTCPKIIEMMGGKEKTKEQLSKSLSTIKVKEMKMDSFTFPESPKFFDSKSNNFVIVPTLSIVSVKGQRAESHNFQLGIKAFGENKWTYIEGSRVNFEFLKQLFVDFPENIEFPKCTRKKL